MLGLIQAFVIFFLNIIETLFRLTLTTSRGPAPSSLPPEELPREQQVVWLEDFRLANGLKEGWLFHRTRELGLAREFAWLQSTGWLDNYRRQRLRR